MQKPVDYKQTDPRWANVSYSAKGESTTIGKSGCGPSSMSMVLAQLVDKSITPKTECAWALANGWKCPHSGTYYGYFVPAGKRYGIKVTQLNASNIYGNNKSPYFDTLKAHLQSGKWAILCMGKGLWTSSGHYILAYYWKDGIVYINDPASSKQARLYGDWETLKKQCKYIWLIDAPKEESKPVEVKDPNQIYNEKGEIMTYDELVNKIVEDPEASYKIYCKAMEKVNGMSESEWSVQEGAMKKLVDAGLMNGSNPRSPLSREQFAAMAVRLGLVK